MSSTDRTELKFQKAVYKKQELKEYAGNSLIEALPPILSISKAYEQMLSNPPFEEVERELSTGD